MGLFSRLFGFGRKSVESVPAVEHTCKVIMLADCWDGILVQVDNDDPMTIHVQGRRANDIRIGLLQGITLPVGWQSVAVSGNARINNLFLLVNELTYTDYLRQSGNTVRLAEGVVIV